MHDYKVVVITYACKQQNLEVLIILFFFCLAVKLTISFPIKKIFSKYLLSLNNIFLTSSVVLKQLHLSTLWTGVNS